MRPTLVALLVALHATSSTHVALPRPTLPCVGLVASSTRELYVVGTAHTPCRSAAEVEATVQAIRPDVVVVELDQERLERLMRTPADEELRYGADFAAAAAAAVRVGAPVVLGDARARDTAASLRAPGPIADPARLWRATRVALGLKRGGDPPLCKHPVRVAASFLDDPAKLLPLLAGLWWTVLLTAVSAAQMPPPAVAVVGEVGTPDAGSWAAALVSLLVLAVGTRVCDVLLLSRDDTLAASSVRALELAAGLRTGALLRRRYAFSVDNVALARAPRPPPDALPFFTLRRPLARGEVRRLNLFEPRWLCLLDQLAAARAEAEGGAHVAGGATGETVAGLEGTSFGCVFAVNRCYTPTGAERDGPALGAGKRVADVVIRPYARRVRIVRVEESTRPVTGARRLVVHIIGENPLRIDNASLAPTAGGYLAARVAECSEEEAQGADSIPTPSALSAASAPPVRVVSVVGMAHANGVLDRCALARLSEDGALARAALEEPTDWVGY
jgi:hypothetical protein